MPPRASSTQASAAQTRLGRGVLPQLRPAYPPAQPARSSQVQRPTRQGQVRPRQSSQPRPASRSRQSSQPRPASRSGDSGDDFVNRLLRYREISFEDPNEGKFGARTRRQPSLDPSPVVEKSYRFKVGTDVKCCTGYDEWSVGKIIKLDYRQPEWPRGQTAPYQVELNDGQLIFVPADTEELCRLHIIPWWLRIFYVRGMPFGGKFGREHLAMLQEKSKGQDVNMKDDQGVVALHKAVQHNWQSGVMELLTMKADVTIADNNKAQALHMCVQHGTELMSILLKAKGDPNCRDSNPDYDPLFTSVSFGDRVEHRTPLHYCCTEGLEEQAKMLPVLIQAKADLDIQDGHGKTPLHLAIEENHDKFVDILLSSKADVNLGNLSSNFRNSPLMDAAHEGQSDVALKLIAARADVNKKGKQGLSALHFAARRGCTKMVQILLEAQADPSRTSDLGTALDLAKKNGGAELLNLFGVQPTPITGSITSMKDLDAMQRKALFLE